MISMAQRTTQFAHVIINPMQVSHFQARKWRSRLANRLRSIALLELTLRAQEPASSARGCGMRLGLRPGLSRSHSTQVTRTGTGTGTGTGPCARSDRHGWRASSRHGTCHACARRRIDCKSAEQWQQQAAAKATAAQYAIRTAEQRSSRAELRAQRAAPRADCRGSSGDNRASHPKDDKWIWDFDFSADQHSDGRHIGGLSVQR